MRSRPVVGATSRIGNSMNEVWRALAREAGLAAEHLAIGATALGRANYAQTAYYGQAFFALGIGIERTAKLAIAVDRLLTSGGAFPASDEMRKYGHNLRKLLDETDAIAKRRNLEAILPRTAIHDGIIKVLSEFSANITRYYNLDLVTSKTIPAGAEPIGAWYQLVVEPVLGAHARPRQVKKVEANAALAETLLGPYSSVRHHSETGSELNSVYLASLQTGTLELARPYVRMYVLQIARFLAVLMAELGSQRAGRDSVPDFSEFYRIFFNNDRYFRSRKEWSIYRL